MKHPADKIFPCCGIDESVLMYVQILQKSVCTLFLKGHLDKQSIFVISLTVFVFFWLPGFYLFGRPVLA